MSVPKINFTSSQVALIKRTLAKDANNNEFDIYLELCRARGLNPLLRHCYCLVMNKDKQEKRQMVVVVSIDGQRHLAERSGSYRPDERAPRFVIDESLKDPKTNPAGLVSAEVSVFKHSHGAWHQVTDISYWEEAAPLKEVWEGGQPSGKFALDTKKDGWRKMPRLMLAKVAEMKVLRKAFPDDFSGLYGEAEMDRGEVLDAAPSEIAEQAEQEARLNKIGGAGRLIVDWMDGGQLDAIPVGQFFDRAAEFIETRPADVTAWKERNRIALKEYWAVAGGDALELKKLIESAEQKAKAIAAQPIVEGQAAETPSQDAVADQTDAPQKPDCTPEQKTVKIVKLLGLCESYPDASKVLLKSHTARAEGKITAEQYSRIADAFTDAAARILFSETNGDKRNEILEKVEGASIAGMISVDQYKEVSKAYTASVGLAA